MSTRYFAVVVLAVTAALGACSGDDRAPVPTDPSFAVGTGHNATDHFKIDEPVEFEVLNPCNGELIDFVGRETGQINAVDTRENLDNGNSIHFEHQAHVVATGTGQQTGTAYAINDVFHESFNSPSPPAPQVTISFRETFHVTSPARGNGVLGPHPVPPRPLPFGGRRQDHEGHRVHEVRAVKAATAASPTAPAPPRPRAFASGSGPRRWAR